MKNTKALLGAVILLGNTVVGATALAADDVTSRDSYCSEKFPAITGMSLATDDPMLKSAQSGDVIDYYGPCNVNPVGKDQVQEQKRENARRWANSYED